MVLTFAYIGGIILLVTYGYRLIFHFARGGKAAPLAPNFPKVSLSTLEFPPTPTTYSVLAALLFCGFAWFMGFQWWMAGASIAVSLVLPFLPFIVPMGWIWFIRWAIELPDLTARKGERLPWASILFWSTLAGSFLPIASLWLIRPLTGQILSEFWYIPPLAVGVPVTWLCLGIWIPGAHKRAIRRHEIRVTSERARAHEAEANAAREAERQTRVRKQEYARFRESFTKSEYFRTMDPIAFEHLTAGIYGRLGWDTKIRPASGDGGVDVEIRKGGVVKFVQCKRVQGSVGRPVVQQLYGVMMAEQADGGILVTTGKASEQARKFAIGKDIEIVELPGLMEMAKRAYPEGVVPQGFLVPEKAIEAAARKRRFRRRRR